MDATQRTAADAVEVTAGPDADPLSDRTLVQDIIGGSQDALATLYDRHVGAVHGASMRIGATESLAAEVVQDTFLSLWNHAERYDPDRGSLATWLQAIARNRTIDRLRAAARRGPTATFSSIEAGALDPEAMGDWLTAAGDLIAAGEREVTPEAALSAAEQRRAMREAIASLRPVEQTVILLAYQAGMSQSEIATKLNWPLGTVKTRTRHALLELRARLEASEMHVSAKAPQPAAAYPTVAAGAERPCWPMPGTVAAAALASPCS
jgi:RNA polymerase sigma-70 factor, ECF subfamily